ncbi:MAG: hypothetical protein LQ339_004254 [Xanthoria mediterranea]|nr:MAG: hypothetical protein LQ339_004254 [Xanthoria mediterranea]
MAPKRKTKKAISNPARGFATTSTVSKTKLSPEESLGSTAPDEPQAQTITRDSPGDDAPVEKELHELSPEELEKQLEENDLQLFVEKYLDKIKRDVSRQVSRLQTEKRLLRPQAESLSTRKWLPPEILELIAQTLDAEQQPVRPDLKSQFYPITEALSEEDLCIKIWTLKRVLIQLGSSHEESEDAIKHLLKVAQSLSTRDSLVGKDNIWGLDWCLDWLAMHCEAHAMPSYVTDRVGENTTTDSVRHHQNDASIWSLRTSSTGSDNADTRTIQQVLETSSSYRKQTNGPGDTQNTGVVTTSADYDTENDTDPDTMTETYVTLQTQLYALQPDLQSGVRQAPGNCKAASRVASAKNLPQQIARILQKLERLKADILFDPYEAEQKWTETRNKLAQAAAERKRLHLHSEDRSAASQNDHNHVTSNGGNQLNEASKDSEEDGGVEALGEFFSGLPDTPPSGYDDHLISDAEGKEPESRVVVLKDFGKWNGVNPRRTFEEACKARDASVRVTYRLIDRSPFSKQHSVSIRWSCNQPQPLNPPNDAILCEANGRNVRVEMITEAVPDAAQSEAYVSTAALFLIFSPVPKEEKASLRLPPVWKDFWLDLCTLKKKNDLAIDREELRGIRSLFDHSAGKDEDLEQISRPAQFTPIRPQPINCSAEESQKGKPSGTENPDEIRSVWTSKSATPSFRNMMLQRKNLPIWAFKEEIVQTILGHQTVIVCGETGCGKSTQVPSFILEHELSLGRACKVYCTEPRRISAISLARRVSEELGERKSDVGTFRSLVGYAIRLESKLVHETRLVYATTGIVMRMLEASDDLQELTHLVLDEVHERSIESDFLLIVLRKLLVRRPGLKVILMSATVDAAKFSDYFNGAPVLTVPGRTFPVQTRYLEDAVEETNFSNRDFLRGVPSIDEDEEGQDSSSEKDKKAAETGLEGYSLKTRSTLAQLDEYRINYDLIVNLLETIATKPRFIGFSKAVLVFLPGIAEIRRLHDMLRGHNSFSEGWYIHPLHSTIAMDEQERAFAIPPQGHRKIVLATNIAETGVTIPDVTCVIDTGKHKEMRFDERRQLSRLIEVFISRANAKQRKGRAGRVQEGICFHLFTKSRHDSVLAPDQTPEILRLSLQDLVLRVKICKLGAIEHTLAEALDPPLAKNIRRAIDALVDVKALTASEELTPLGRQLAKLPLDVFLGKVILLGCIFRCLDGAVTIAAILSSKSPFSAPMGARSQADQARLAFKRGDSDLLTVYNAYSAWRRVCNSSGASEQQFCRKNFLLQQNLANIEELKAQLITCLVDAKFIALESGEKSALNKFRSWSSRRSFVEVPARYDQNSSDLMLNCVVGWSFYPKLLRREGKGWRNVANNQSVSLSPTSVNKGVGQTPNWLSFYHIMQSSNKYYNAHETGAMEPLALALACGDADFKMYSGMIVIDGNRIRFSVDDWKIMLAIKTLRLKVRQLLAQSFRDPGRELSSQQQSWLGIWEKMVEYQEKRQASGDKPGAGAP